MVSVSPPNNKHMKLSTSPSKEGKEDGIAHVASHRRSNSFSSIAKAYRSMTEKSRTSTTKLKSTSNGPLDAEDSQQLIAVLEHQVQEGEKLRKEMGLEITKLKDQLQRAEAQVTLLKQANSTLQDQLQQCKAQSTAHLRAPIRRATDTCISFEDKPFLHKSFESEWEFVNPESSSPPTTDPLTESLHDDNSMHDSDDSDTDTEVKLNTIINNINLNSYNNINNIQVNNIQEINYIFDINNISTINNYTTTNNIHTTNNFHTSHSLNLNNFTPSQAIPILSRANSEATHLGTSPRDELSVKFTEPKRSRLVTRATTHHKRRGSETEPMLGTGREEKYQRRHSEGKALRIAGIREQVRVAVLQILTTTYAESEDEWPAVQQLLQGDLSSLALPPPPRHLVHAGFVHEGEHDRDYWVDDVLLLLFKSFLIVACQPKNDTKAKYQFKEVIRLTASSKVIELTNLTEHHGFIITGSPKRSYLLNTKEENDKWISVLEEQLKAIPSLLASQEHFFHYLIAPCEGYNVESTTVVAPGESKLSLEEPRKSIYHYQSFFYNKPHANYVGGSTTYPVVISIEEKPIRFALSPSVILRRSVDVSHQEPEPVSYRTLVRTVSGDECMCVPVPANLARSTQTAHNEVLAHIARTMGAQGLPLLKVGTTIFRVKANELETELLQYESNNMRRCHKIGIVYCAKGAKTESEMLATTRADASPEFEQFLTSLGQEVALKDWSEYAGGLDVKHDSDGTHSMFTNFWGIPIMFHVSTMLPNDRNNPNIAISKKRHIGNDIVVVIFKNHDDDSLFVPSTFKSHLNRIPRLLSLDSTQQLTIIDIFCVVQQVKSTDGGISYKVSFCSKDGIGSYSPALPSPPVFPRDARFKHFLLAKIVNAERAAMRSAPFAKRHALARHTFLKSLWRKVLFEAKRYGVHPKETEENPAYCVTTSMPY